MAYSASLVEEADWIAPTRAWDVLQTLCDTNSLNYTHLIDLGNAFPVNKWQEALNQIKQENE